MRVGTHDPCLHPLSHEDQPGTRERSRREWDSLQFVFFWTMGALNALRFPTRASWEMHNKYMVCEQ